MILRQDRHRFFAKKQDAHINTACTKKTPAWRHCLKLHIYDHVISERNPETGELKEVTRFKDILNYYWGKFYDGYFYYIIDSLPGCKASLTRVALTEGAQPEVLWESGRYQAYPYISGFQMCDHLLILNIPEMGIDKITIFDVEKNELLLERSERLGGSVYNAGRLYYIDERKHTIEVYDIKAGANVDSIDIKCNDFTLSSLACDENYLYFSEDQWSETADGFRSKLHVYDYDGNYINTITVDDAVDFDYTCFLFSTDTKVYIGNRYNYWP